MRSIYKPIYVSNILYKVKNLFFFFKIENKQIFLATRNSTIISLFQNKFFKIHNGLKTKIIYVQSYMIGHKFGEFFMTRKRAVFKPKLLKKK